MTEIKFYGTRGSYSLTSEKYMEFGGATSCIVFRFDDTVIMVDSGSGVVDAIEDLKDVETLHLFISHRHIDHIEGIVTLLPAFKDRKLHIYSKSFYGISTRDSLNRITSQSLWPVKADVYDNVEFHELDKEIQINEVSVDNMDSNHPDGCSLFRFRYKDEDIVTAFDYCHLDGYEEKLMKFAKGTRILIYDGCLSEEDLIDRPNWGHSTPEAGVRIARNLDVEHLYVTHFGVYDDEKLNIWERKLQKEYPNVSFARSGYRKSDFLKMLDIGSLLNVEKDNDALLLKIVEGLMEITGADGGTLYLLENKQLEFKVMINQSMNIRQIRKDVSLGIPAVKLEDKNICAASAREKKLINIKDCYSEKNYDFSGVRKYDKLNNYLTKSVLVVPLVDDHDELIGVLQLINSKDKTGNTISFSKRDESVALSVANQAAMSIVNSLYSQKVDDLLYGFVKTMSVGIDERTPYNANHTKNMARFAEKFLDYQKKTNGRYNVDINNRREILMSVWLHDVGKILIPLDIMNKDSKLGPLVNDIDARFDRIDLLLRLELANGVINQEDFDEIKEERANDLNFIHLINLVGFLRDDSRKRLDKIAKKKYREIDGSYKSIITSEEYYCLSTKNGTLTREERAIMENHVVMTQKLLSQLNFPKDYENIPSYAGNHHEFLDGSGYPNHLKAEELVWQCRLITVLDIFEALTAKDRPYKKTLNEETALSVLRNMAADGKLDGNIIDEFEKSQAWIIEE